MFQLCMFFVNANREYWIHSITIGVLQGVVLMHLAWCNFAEYHPTICRVPFLQMTMLEDLSCILHVITPFSCIVT